MSLLHPGLGGLQLLARGPEQDLVHIHILGIIVVRML